MLKREDGWSDTQRTGPELKIQLKPQRLGHSAEEHNDTGQWQNESAVHRADACVTWKLFLYFQVYLSWGVN